MGRGRWMDNVFIERLWRSIKHEDIYLKGTRELAIVMDVSSLRPVPGRATSSATAGKVGPSADEIACRIC